MSGSTLWAWGPGDHGQLGDGRGPGVHGPAPRRIAAEIVEVSGGHSFALARCADGTVLTWGANDTGVLGDGTMTSRSTPAPVGGLDDVVAVAAGFASSYALRGDGTVWAWGANGSYQLGDGSQESRLRPARIVGLDGVVAIAAGECTAYALKADGTVWSWGANGAGQCGNGFDLGAVPTPREAFNFRFMTPDGAMGECHSISELAEATGGIVSIAAGYRAAYALGRSGLVVAWGSSESGQLGDGSHKPDQVALFDLMVGYVQWAIIDGLPPVVQVASLGNAAYALAEDGTVWSWGADDCRQLGAAPRTSGDLTSPGALFDALKALPGIDSNRTLPGIVDGLASVVQIATSADTAYALKSDGSVWAWGEGEYGCLGDGTRANRARPSRVDLGAPVSVIAGGLLNGYAVGPATA
ncbi:MAG: RCC1 repeat- and reductase domain-containing protein [Cellulomonadaceae bacterium]|nr:RCC1 repeat- and reductase domain-containing protein [Cellulomonadaceae bacterium]